MMANPHKGDVPFLVGDKTYTLRYSHLALVKLEEQTNKPVVEVMRELENAKDGNIRIKTIVSIIWAGLQKHHPKMTFEDAADLLDEVEGGTAAAVQAIGTAFEKAFAAPGTKGTHPPGTNGLGTGTDFSSSTSPTAINQTLSGTSLPES